MSSLRYRLAAGVFSRVLLRHQPSPDLLEDPRGGRFDHFQHVRKRRPRPAIGIRHIDIIGRWIKTAEHPHLVVGAGAGHGPQIPQVRSVRGQQEIDRGHLLRSDLPGDMVEGITTGSQNLGGRRIGLLSHMPGTDTGAAHPDPITESGPLQRGPKHVFADRRAADVATTDHADMEEVVGHSSIVPENNRRGLPGRLGRVTTQATVDSITASLWAAYPHSLAQEWDTGIGLTCGDPEDAVNKVLFAVDVDDRTVAQALDLGVQMLITHHPLLFAAVKSVAANTPKGRLIHRMQRAGVAHFAAHTNADCAASGVSDALAAGLGVIDTRPIETSPMPPMDKLVVYVPRENAAVLVESLAAAGAGRFGDYADAAFVSEGFGQFRPLPGANPAIGEINCLERLAESRIDMFLLREHRDQVLRALRAVHPYEEPGFDLTEIVRLPAPGAGLGRIGRLEKPLALRDFVALVAAKLPATAAGVTATGDPERVISTVAVCGGAGASLLDRVGAADAYVTADLSHHTSAEFVAESGRPALVQVAHWASEWPWLNRAAGVVRAAHPDAVETVISKICTDAWTFHLPGSLDLGREDRF